jgi:CubicO group peptidase (beta-lactamase class C family)
MPGAGTVRSSVNDLAVFLKACMGLSKTSLSASISQLRQTRRPTPLAGTDAGLGWFITSGRDEEIVWKSGLSGGCNTFVGYSTRHGRGALVLSNFLWQPIDKGTINLGLNLINRKLELGDSGLLYL